MSECIPALLRPGAWPLGGFLARLTHTDSAAAWSPRSVIQGDRLAFGVGLEQRFSELFGVNVSRGDTLVAFCRGWVVLRGGILLHARSHVSSLFQRLCRPKWGIELHIAVVSHRYRSTPWDSGVIPASPQMRSHSP
jgi:hypothetical protein